MEPREYSVVRGLGIVGHFKWDNLGTHIGKLELLFTGGNGSLGTWRKGVLGKWEHI